MNEYSMNYLFGLDIGTSGVKALLISPEGKIISSKTESYPLAPPPLKNNTKNNRKK